MELPLFIGGSEAGTLRVTQSGLYTLMETGLDGGAERLIRLWAHGGGRSACLGVMQPRDGGLWLSRRFSRLALRDFPDPLEFASDSERCPAADETAEEGNTQVDSLHNDKPEIKKEIEISDSDCLHKTETDMRSCPWPVEPPEEGLLWYARPDGTLVSFDGISTLLALPAELRACDPRAALRVIEGKRYLVFRT